MTALAALQARFLALVTTGRGDPRGLLASGELGIYAHAYGARLLEALRGDHPKLEAALGAAQFATLIEGYVAARPPSSFTLRDYGIDLPGWLATADAPPWAADLARLERARVEVFDAADQVALSRDEVAALSRPRPWPRCRSDGSPPARWCRWRGPSTTPGAISRTTRRRARRRRPRGWSWSGAAT
jgi:hypothetical protein